jgi:hypothetical protein
MVSTHFFSCISNNHHEQEDSIARNQFNVVDENIVDSIHENNVEIDNKQT